MNTTAIAWFPWKDEYSVRIPEIDCQHKKLVQLINDLQEAMAAGQGESVLGPLLTELIAYTVSHFTAEELLMQKFKYPDLARHKEEHVKLSGTVLKLREDYRAGRAAMTVQLMQFLKNWLSSHIVGADRKCAVFILSKNSG